MPRENQAGEEECQAQVKEPVVATTVELEQATFKFD